jgi:uncharacterized membrane protein YoaK (UPF0700 family)
MTNQPLDSGHKGAIAEKTLKHLPAALSLIAGMADVTSWLTLSGLFSAHITGNIVVAIADWARGESPHTAQVLAIPVFGMGVVLADLWTRSFSARRSATIGSLLLGQFLLLASASALAAATHPSTDPNGGKAIGVGMLAVTAMAVQNTLVHLAFKPAPTTAIMTGNIVVIILALIDIALERGSHKLDAIQKWQATWPLLVGFLAGCLAGATAVALTHDLAWLLPTVTSLVLVLYWGSPKNPLDDRGSDRRRDRSIE